jgi:hypothetical protein
MRGQFDSAATVRTLVALALGAAALSGCHPKHAGGHFGVHVDSGGGDFVGFGDGPVRAPASLTCPAQVDDLARTAQAADGKSCAYSGANGSTVELSLMPLDGQTPQVRLASLEQTLKGQLGPIDASGGVHISADGDHDRANIDLPGFHLHANGDGKANISMPGVTINADGDKAQVNAGWGAHKAVVNANSNGAEVRAGSVNTSVADLTYVLASSTAGPTGLRAAGYMARGPAAGPLVVGVFRTPESEHAHELNDHGLQRLIRINTDAG